MLLLLSAEVAAGSSWGIGRPCHCTARAFTRASGAMMIVIGGFRLVERLAG
ncbi:hypothetical protein [Streptomyces sp. NBC_01750]|uniref:hypothetical protein n=1 Tax=Streptomyces sp. NBC_01750 TaxID=2975928 RepID=UPI002DDB44DB|nr:hypothetical protein [Streptomyces sp. NBC_01750]WSD36206.1 hypothetical protein OG966_32450 [Streptomyces sp. NBC_01750]